MCEIGEQGERQELVTGLLIDLGRSGEGTGVEESREVSISNKLSVSHANMPFFR